MKWTFKKPFIKEARTERYTKRIQEGMKILIGIDLHKKKWHITIFSEGGEIWNGNIPGEWDALRSFLDRYQRCLIHAVYEAGCFGFWLYNRLTAYGAICVVTPPSLVPSE